MQRVNQHYGLCRKIYGVHAVVKGELYKNVDVYLFFSDCLKFPDCCVITEKFYYLFVIQRIKRIITDFYHFFYVLLSGWHGSCLYKGGAEGIFGGKAYGNEQDFRRADKEL